MINPTELARHTTGADMSSVQAELGRRVYTNAERLRIRSLARVGLTEAGVRIGVSQDLTLFTRGRHLRLDIGIGPQLREGNRSLRSIGVHDNPQHAEEFLRERFVEPTGHMWQMADSSQGEPWYPANLPVSDLAEMLERIETFETTAYDIEFKLSAHQQKLRDRA